MVAEDFTSWKHKLVVLTSYDGENTTAQIIEVDTKQNQIVVDVIDSNRPYSGSDHHAFTLSTVPLIAVHDAPTGVKPLRPLPEPDLCRQPSPLSSSRFTVFTLLCIVLLGTMAMFSLFEDWGYALQLASLIGYTAAVTLGTFSTSRGGRPYLYSCPIVQRQIPRLLRRHVGFLTAFLILLTMAWHLRPHLPIYWITASGRNGSPFATTLFILCAIFAVAQTVTNRSLIESAHLEFTPTDPTGSPASQP